MQFSLALVALVASLASAAPQGVTQSISPPESAPQGCQVTYPDEFSITTVNVSESSSVKKRQTNQMGGLTITIKNGVMKDGDGDTGYIAANKQFQFDKPPQTGAIYTAGWSVCANKTIALGGSTIFYSCNSGNFNNLYSKSQGKQCSQVFISAMSTGSSSGSSSSGSSSSSASASAPASSSSGGVSSIADNQPQAATSAGVSTIADNQPQAGTSAGVSTIADNQPQAATSAGISTIADNQPQAPTSAAAAISTIADNQPQAPTMANASYTYAVATGAAVINRPEVMALAAGAMALLF